MTPRSTVCLPLPVGSRKTYTPTQLAERAIEQIDLFETHGTKKRPKGGRYGFFMDHKGRAWLDKPPEALHENWILTITRKTNPLDITDEIVSAEA